MLNDDVQNPVRMSVMYAFVECHSFHVCQLPQLDGSDCCVTEFQDSRKGGGKALVQAAYQGSLLKALNFVVQR